MISPLAYVDKEARIGTDNIAYQGRARTQAIVRRSETGTFCWKAYIWHPTPI